MPFSTELFLAACMFLGAVLYTSVGHAGASAYIALMALFGAAPAVMRPTALALNILVASFTSAPLLASRAVPLANRMAVSDRRDPYGVPGRCHPIPGAYYGPLSDWSC